jgi:hypothetical protein
MVVPAVPTTAQAEVSQSRPEEQHMTSKTHSVSGEMFRMGIAAAAGAAAAYGGRALWKQWPAIMASAAVGQVGKVADKVKDGAVEGASRVSDGARQTATEAASTSRSAAKKAGSGGVAAAGRTTSAARRTTGATRGTTTAARRASSGGSATKSRSTAKSRARKPA